MEGATSLDEERRLAEYFRSHPDEPGMEDIASLFALFDTGMPIEGITDVKPRAPKAHTARRITLHRAWWTSVAAVALLLVAFTFGIRHLTPLRKQETAQTVCHVPRQDSGEGHTAQPLAETVAEPVAKPDTKTIITPTTEPVPHVAHSPLVAQAKPKAQPKPAPEMVPDSVMEAILMEQEAAALLAYNQMQAEAQAEEALLAQAEAMDRVADYVANIEYVETIPVW